MVKVSALDSCQVRRTSRYEGCPPWGKGLVTEKCMIFARHRWKLTPEQCTMQFGCMPWL